MRTIALAVALAGTLCCSGETVVYDDFTSPLETEMREGAWCVKVDCDLSDCGEVTLEFAKPVRQGERFQVQFLNDGARESLTRGNGGANILQYMIWKFPPEGTNRVTLLLPPDVPAFRACASRVKETRLWGLWARLWKNRYVKERTGTDGGHLLCCTLDPAKVKEIRVVRMGRTVAEMQYPGAAPAARVTRIVAGGEPMRIDEKDLPIKNCAYTQCFRREAGSYGKDVRGLNRLHEFSKIEIVRIDTPEHSKESHKEMLAHVESLLQKLELPYRILHLCGGDMSFTAATCFDFEVFSAAQKRWLEVSSVSNFDTYQANRLKCRYKGADKKAQLCHTLNGSAMALPRIVAALLENNQTPEGIKVPKVLVPYMGCDIIK